MVKVGDVVEVDFTKHKYIGKVLQGRVAQVVEKDNKILCFSITYKDPDNNIQCGRRIVFYDDSFKVI